MAGYFFTYYNISFNFLGGDVMLNDYEKVQPVAYKILSNAIKSNQFNHAYLFETNGYESGMDMAISFAKSILKIEGQLDEENHPELKIIYPN